LFSKAKKYYLFFGLNIEALNMTIPLREFIHRLSEIQSDQVDATL